MSEIPVTAPARKIPAWAKAAMQLQVFLLRRNWLGALGQELMVITTLGRKSGQSFSTPIGYVRDGAEVIGLSVEGRSHWYKNLLHNPSVRLTLGGQEHPATAQAVQDPAERQRIFELYQRERAKHFSRLFGVPVEATPAQLAQALATRQFVRFRLTH